MKLVVDASIAMKWLVPEALHEEAVALLDVGSAFLAPDLLVAEVGNALWKKVQRGEITPLTAERALLAVSSGFPVLHRSTTLASRALQIALQLRHPIYDCLYLACAEVAEAVLITEDRRFHAAAVRSDLGIEVKRLSEISGSGFLQ